MGAWHIPLLFMAGTGAVGGGRLHPQDAPLAIFFLFIGYGIPLRIILTWVYNSTRGSLLVVALTHQGFDQVAGPVIFATLFSGVPGAWPDIVPAIFALAIVLLTRGRLGYRAEQQVAPAQPIPAAAAV